MRTSPPPFTPGVLLLVTPALLFVRVPASPFVAPRILLCPAAPTLPFLRTPALLFVGARGQLFVVPRVLLFLTPTVLLCMTTRGLPCIPPRARGPVAGALLFVVFPLRLLPSAFAALLFSPALSMRGRAVFSAPLAFRGASGGPGVVGPRGGHGDAE